MAREEQAFGVRSRESRKIAGAEAAIAVPEG
jgi:hypothetical protein